MEIFKINQSDYYKRAAKRLEKLVRLHREEAVVCAPIEPVILKACLRHSRFPSSVLKSAVPSVLERKTTAFEKHPKYREEI